MLVILMRLLVGRGEVGWKRDFKVVMVRKRVKIVVMREV